MAYHAEILPTTCDHAASTAALETADQHHRLVMGNYLLLIGERTVDNHLPGSAMEGDWKGKGCGRSSHLEDTEKGNGTCVSQDSEEHDNEDDGMDLA